MEILQREKGVATTEAEFAGGKAVVGYDARVVTPQQLARKLTCAGFGTTVQAVLTPAQYEKLTGHSICREGSHPGCEAKSAETGCGWGWCRN